MEDDGQGTGSSPPPLPGFGGSGLGTWDSFWKHQGKQSITDGVALSINYSDLKGISWSTRGYQYRDAGGVHLVFGNRTVFGAD